MCDKSWQKGPGLTIRTTYNRFVNELKDATIVEHPEEEENPKKML
jgi:hypothetical protein